MYRGVMPAKDLVAASSRPIILSVLAGGESYGYAIIQEVKQLSGGALEYTDGMLYPVLHRLEREGLVRGRWGSSDTGRKRRYYRLSREGDLALREERAQWLSVHNTLAGLWGLKPCSI
jgi:DNA-binding PadR family transcriptional regulator